MGKRAHTVSILNSERKGLKVLVIDPDENRSVEYESKTELDSYLQRVSVFFVSNIRDARDLAKSKHIEIAIFPETLEKLDFVSIQSELKNANPQIRSIPLALNPTLSQYRESKQIGGVLDFGEPTALLTYNSLRDLIVHATREYTKAFSFEARYKQMGILQRALLLKDQNREYAKILSSQTCAEFARHFDLGIEETTAMVLAEQIYLPELSLKDYSHLLHDQDDFEILELLKQTASLSDPNSKPSSANGFIITSANAFAFAIFQEKELADILAEFKARPHHLFHPSLRVLTPDILASTYELLSSFIAKRRLG